MQKEKTWKPSKTDSIINTWMQAKKNFKEVTPLIDDEITAIYKGESKAETSYAIEILEDIIKSVQKTIDTFKN